jgi:hypothetical protein
LVLNPSLVDNCFNKLLEVAKSHAPTNLRPVITYGEMAKYLGVTNQSVGKYLDAIYIREVQNRSNIPDLTTLVVYKDTNYGRYNSRGASVRSEKVNPDCDKHRNLYDEEIKRVCEYWGSKRKV